ncbi:kinase-like domain-containing protein [Mycena olivaceomarginata]|nr:kinase-like domain-containing protein [Mycena olivaceomarginata]
MSAGRRGLRGRRGLSNSDPSPYPYPPVPVTRRGGADILITEQGIVKLIDLGFSKIFTGVPFTNATDTGTYGFVPPEIIRKTGDYSMKSDIWSLGCLVLEVFENGPV